MCLADYCAIFRCEVLKKKKRSLRSFNPLARGSKETKGKVKRIISDQQLTVLRSQCSVSGRAWDRLYSIVLDINQSMYC